MSQVMTAMPSVSRARVRFVTAMPSKLHRHPREACPWQGTGGEGPGRPLVPPPAGSPLYAGMTDYLLIFRESFSVGPSDALDDRRRAHPGADAQGHECGAKPRPLQFVERGAEDHRASGAERVAHRDRPAIDVELLRVELQKFLVK